MMRTDCRRKIKKLQKGTVVPRRSVRYLRDVQQYAWSSHLSDNVMTPRFIIYPTDELDIKEILAYAVKKGYNVAVRTGGHQYSGASSTKGGGGPAAANGAAARSKLASLMSSCCTSVSQP
jgi:FAD/FMN-containing dehydrogenase